MEVLGIDENIILKFMLKKEIVTSLIVLICLLYDPFAGSGHRGNELL
jgi:hypothetical protein